MFKQIGLDVVPLTKEFAVSFSALPTYGGDRDRYSRSGQNRCDWLQAKIDDGTFYSPTWSTAVLRGRLYRVDGGHSSLMLESLNGEFPAGMLVAIRRFQCESEIDMAYLFDQFDHRKSLRSMADKINCHKAIEQAVSEISVTHIRVILGGLAYSLCGCGEERTLDEDERVKLLHEYSEFIVWANSYVGPKFMKRNGVVAAMYATHQRNASLATAFWDEVVNASNPDNENGSRKLNAFLVTTSVNHTTQSHSWDARAFFCKSIHAYNAWRMGVRTDLKYHQSSALPSLK